MLVKISLIGIFNQQLEEYQGILNEQAEGLRAPGARVFLHFPDCTRGQSDAHQRGGWSDQSPATGDVISITAALSVTCKSQT